MTKPKCPLCGEMLTGSKTLRGIPLYFVECDKCNYRLRESPDKDFAWEYANIFVSKFPPIMRVQVGDKLIYFGTSDIVTVVWKDMEICRIKIKDATGERYIIEPEDVHEWPWDLEQKGEGNND